MTRLWSPGQPIQVQLNSQGQPIRFTWLNRHYRIHQVRQRWQVDTDWWAEQGHIWRDYLAVTTQEGLLAVLYQDLLTEQWYLSKTYD